MFPGLTTRSSEYTSTEYTSTEYKSTRRRFLLTCGPLWSLLLLVRSPSVIVSAMVRCGNRAAAGVVLRTTGRPYVPRSPQTLAFVAARCASEVVQLATSEIRCPRGAGIMRVKEARGENGQRRIGQVASLVEVPDRAPPCTVGFLRSGCGSAVGWRYAGTPAAE